MQVITSLQNLLIKELALCAKDIEYAHKVNLFIIDGFNLITMYKSYSNIKYVIVDKKLQDKYQEYLNGIDDDKLIIVDDKIIRKISQTNNPQGIIIVVDKIQINTINSQNDNILVLDAISDPGNFGTIIRTAHAFGYKTIYAINCTNYCQQKVIRSSMGSIFYVKIVSCDYSILQSLKDYQFVALQANCQDISLFSVKDDIKYAICVGSEAHGLNEKVKEITSTFLSIKMQEGIESLNAAIALSIAAYKFSIK